MADMFQEGIASTGRVLLERPAWDSGRAFSFRFLDEVLRDGKWHKFGDYPNRNNDKASALPAVWTLCKPDQDCIVFAGVNIPHGERSFAQSDLPLIWYGDSGPGEAAGTNLLSLPRFPVREGSEIVSCNGTLMRQEAHSKGNGVEITLQANGITWVQFWKPASHGGTGLK